MLLQSFHVKQSCKSCRSTHSIVNAYPLSIIYVHVEALRRHCGLLTNVDRDDRDVICSIHTSFFNTNNFLTCLIIPLYIFPHIFLLSTSVAHAGAIYELHFMKWRFYEVQMSERLRHRSCTHLWPLVERISSPLFCCDRQACD